MDNATSSQTPRALVKLVEQIVPANSEILASPQSEYNYSVQNVNAFLAYILKNAFSKHEVNDLFEGLPTIRAMCFPKIERENIALHAVIGHEVGHELASEFIEFENKSNEGIKTTNYWLKQTISELNLSSLPDSQKNAALRTVSNIRQRALEELVSDVVCVSLMGPCGLFAINEVLSRLADLDTQPGPTDYYPPSRYRIRTALGVLDDLGAFDGLIDRAKESLADEHRASLDNYVNHVRSTATQNSDIASINADAKCQLAYRWVEETLPRSVTYVRNHLDELNYDRTIVEARLPALIGRILLRVPPNETGVYPNAEVADWCSALHATWIVSLIKYGSQDDQDLAKIDERELTSVAIEYISIQNEWASRP